MGSLHSEDFNLRLSGSGESFSEDSNHYLRGGHKVPHLKPGSAGVLMAHATAVTSPSHGTPAHGTGDASSMASYLGDFNERFQQTVDRMRNPAASVVERLTCNINLSDLAQDFLSSATAYGKIIISEYGLPLHLKTIKPSTDMGGFLGGKKYRVRNILFKFATDETGIFMNNHAAAAKVAGNELRGLIAYFGAGVEGLSFPLTCLIDFKGYRLVASTLLPIDGSKTLVYGSSNAGKLFVNDSPALYKGKMSSICFVGV